MHLGALSFRPSIALRDIGRDTNVFLSSADPLNAWTATLSPAVKGAVRFGTRGFVTMNLGGDYVWFSPVSVSVTQTNSTTGSTTTIRQRRDDLSHTNLITAIKGNLVLRDLRLFASADYQRHEERPNNELDQRAKRTNLVQRAGVGYEYSPKTAVDFIVSRERVAYRDPDFQYGVPEPDRNGNGTLDIRRYTLDDLLTRNETTETLRLSQRIFGRTRLVLDAQAKRYNFLGTFPTRDVDGNLPLVGSVRDAAETRFSAGFEVDPGSVLSGSLRAGTIDFRPRLAPATDQNTTQAVWALNLNWRILSRVSLATGLDRELFFSTFSDNLYFRQDHLAVQCVYYLNRILGVEAGYDGYRLLYPTTSSVNGPSGTSIFQGRRRDEVRVLKGGLRFRVADRTFATLRVGTRRRTSNIPDSDDHQLLVTTGVETNF